MARIKYNLGYDIVDLEDSVLIRIILLDNPDHNEILFDLEVDKKGEGWGRVSLKHSFTFLTYMEQRNYVLQRMEQSGIHSYSTPEDILSFFKRYKFERVVYDARLFKFVTLNQLQDTSLNVYKALNAGWYGNINVLASSIEEAKQKINIRLAEKNLDSCSEWHKNHCQVEKLDLYFKGNIETFEKVFNLKDENMSVT